tara:strand:+ start:1680 stop:2756 length:1077 start_codon:yes stop_codon:yes gene_type:complete
MNFKKKIFSILFSSGFFLLLASFIYDLITSLRNFLYDKKIFSSINFKIPIISVGNISLGGTGKTPLVEYLANYYLKKKYKIAILSRGYKRKSKGYLEANESQDYLSIGDEPMQFYLKFKKKIVIVVCEDRVYAIQKIQKKYPKTNLIILDDGFQQRKINSSFNIINSQFSKPFFNDYLFPYGFLREKRKNINRAHLLIFSKVLKTISSSDFKNHISKSLKYFKNENKIFFSEIKYLKPVPLFGNNTSLNKINNFISVSSISDSNLFDQYLISNYNIIKNYKFSDHHIYNLKEIDSIINSLDERTALIITEKDEPKFKIYKNKLSNYSIFKLPIKITLIDKKNQFFNSINSYLNLYNNQ